MRTRSPPRRVTGPEMRRPLTKVPLVEPRSSSTTVPSTCGCSSAWRREASPSARVSSQSEPRPTRKRSPATSAAWPCCEPDANWSRGAMGGHPRGGPAPLTTAALAHTPTSFQSADADRLGWPPFMAGDRIEVTDGPARGEQSELDKELLIGRSTEGFGALKGDPEISRRHAQISRTDEGRLYISDLGSTNGTFVNGKKIEGSAWLATGDVVKVGESPTSAPTRAGAAPGAAAAGAAAAGAAAGAGAPEAGGAAQRGPSPGGP